MFKRIVILVLISTILIMSSSCSSPTAYDVWKEMCDQYPDQKGRVRIVSDNDEGDYHIKYDGVDYYVDKLGLFTLKDGTHEVSDNDVIVAWDLNWYLYKYYSYTSDDPIFIYSPTLDQFFLRNDYNFETDTFVIEGSDKEFVFGDMLYSSTKPSYTHVFYPYGTDVAFYSKQCPRLQIRLRLFCIGSTWYLGAEYDNAFFEVSEELLKMLNVN